MLAGCVVGLRVPPVEDALGYISAQLASPSFDALSRSALAVAVVALPCCVQNYAADNAYENQADASEDEIGAGAQAGEADAQRLVACRGQEV
jgi:hypothetical protein